MVNSISWPPGVFPCSRVPSSSSSPSGISLWSASTTFSGLCGPYALINRHHDDLRLARLHADHGLLESHNQLSLAQDNFQRLVVIVGRVELVAVCGRPSGVNNPSYAGLN